MTDVIIKQTPIGRKAFPVATDEAEKLVLAGKAIKINNRLYEELIEPAAPKKKATKKEPDAKKAPKAKKAATKKSD